MEKPLATEKTVIENNETSTEATDEPLSPSSTTTSADATFEPTIDELVNDFDDEQTLNEEEALAASENNNPQDEIATLKEESEMPLEELLAKYRALPPLPLPLPNDEPPRKKTKKSHSEKKKQAKIVKEAKHQEESIREVSKSPIVTMKPEDEKKTPVEKDQTNGEVIEVLLVEEEPITPIVLEEQKNEEKKVEVEIKEKEIVNLTTDLQTQDKLKIRRSHLFELYPEQNFDEAIAAVQNQGVPLDTIYSEEEEDEIEEEDIDPDYVKKTIMVGSAFQAVIPGLSQYGDILPYENVDKLVWEPSQVSEAEVEDYLLKIREIKASPTDDAVSSSLGDNEKSDAMDVDVSAAPTSTTISSKPSNEVPGPQKTLADNKRLATSMLVDPDQSGVVKDNEQALHLLVQCGYDFKEALRRKRLNAVPLTGGTMSIWSEEECQKFEEGIQKYGKDFLKIRQNQVRTRTMRELVQFYYLWKKSERRDHNFANSDTVDHMDIFLNEGEDYSSSPVSNVPTAATGTGSAPCRKMNGVSQSNFSIMTGNHSGSSPTKNTNSNSVNGNKKRSTNDTTSGNPKNNNVNIAINSDHHSPANSLLTTTPTPTPTK